MLFMNEGRLISSATNIGENTVFFTPQMKVGHMGEVAKGSLSGYQGDTAISQKDRTWQNTQEINAHRNRH